MTDEERAEMMRRNWAAQMGMLGYGPDGNPEPEKPKDMNQVIEDMANAMKKLEDYGLEPGVFHVGPTLRKALIDNGYVETGDDGIEYVMGIELVTHEVHV